MDRLSVVDEMFLRSHRGLGTPIAMQGLWRTAEPLDPESLAAVHRALAHGPLGRRVVRSRVPGARPRWQPDSTAYPLSYTSEPLPVAELFGWADTQAPNLDPTTGPGWRLSATRLTGGGTLVSLVSSHVLADARGLVLAAARALSGQPSLGTALRSSDWADARRQWSIVARGTARAVAGLVTHPDRRAALTTARESHPPRAEIHAQSLVLRSAVVSVDADEWDLAAAAHNGSPNSLFVAVVTSVLRASGWTDNAVTVALPVDTRTGTSISNAMSMSETTVGQRDTLAVIRRSCRTAYANPMTSPAGFPEELLQVLPDRLAHRLAGGAGERDVLCSNIGTLPDALGHLGGHPTTGIATRAIHPGISASHWINLRTRLSGYLSRTGPQYSLALVSLDPARVASHDALRDLTLAELDRWGLTGQAW